MKYIPLHAPQDTVSGYSFEESADTVAVTARPKPKTVSGILRLLPADATPGQQDSAVQAMMDIPPAIHLSTCPDTLYLPGLKGSPAHADIKKFDLRENYFSDKEYFHPELRVNQIGMAAEPITYRLNSDDYVTGLLLVSFFIVSLFIARNIGILVERIKNFFYFHVDGGDSSMSANPEVRGHIFLILQTCFTLAILFFDYTQLNLTEVFNQVSPYILLGMDTAICFAYFVIKIAAYKMVNWVFFDRVQNRKWLDSYLLMVTLLGLSLFALALLVVYFDVSFRLLGITVVLLVGTFKLLQLIKCRQIFFVYRFSGIHLILYFCTLELIPVLLLWRALVYFNEILIVNI